MRKLLLVFLHGAGMLLFACSSWAQGTAQINGTVTDKSGAVVVSAAVKATQTETGIARTTMSNETGAYALPNLPIGPYRLEVSAQGFQTFVQTGITLEVGTNAVINAQLQLGQVSQTVEVQANAALIDTQSQAITGEVVESERILDIPLNGRNINDLIFLSSGTTQANTGSVNNSQRDAFNINTIPVSVAGGLPYEVSFVLDGASHNNPEYNLPYAVPFPDALQELKVDTIAIGAGSGAFHSAGIVTMATKSGTNSFHGDLFEFVRNATFNARDPFATTPDTLKRNQFGGTIGGPIKKDKLFFFAAYQGTTIAQNNLNLTSVVPTAAMLSGDWTAFAAPACNAGKQLNLGAPFSGNKINPALFSPAALKLVSHLPTTTDPCGTVTYSNPVNSKEHQPLGKVDWQVTPKQSIFVRYLFDYLNSPDPYSLDQNLLSASLNGFYGKAQALTFSHTYLLTNSLINVGRFTFNRVNSVKTSSNTFTDCDLGIAVYCGYGNAASPSAFYPNSGQGDIEKISVTGGVPANVHSAPETLYNPSITDDVTWTHGSHQFTFGGAVAFWRSFWAACAYCSANLSADGTFTGSPYGDLLTGQIHNLNQTDSAGPAGDYHADSQFYLSFYGADTWKLTPRLTLNAGLRWEPYFAIVPRTARGYFATLQTICGSGGLASCTGGVRSPQYVNAPPGISYPGDPTYPYSGVADMKNVLPEFSPRLGLAWDVKGDGRTSVRASFGHFYDNLPANFPINTDVTAPWEANVTLSNVNLDNPWAGYPGGNPMPLPLGLNAAFPQNTPYVIQPSATRNPVVMQWNLSVQKQIKANWQLSVSYLGSESYHLWLQDQANPAVYIPGNCVAGQYGLTAAGPCSQSGTAQTNARRVLTLANPALGNQFSALPLLSSDGTASYNGLLVSGERRVSRGVTITMNYTWSHCIGDDVISSIYGGTGGNGGFPQPSNRNSGRGNCTTASTDIRNEFHATAVLRSPDFASNRILHIVGSGWTFAPIFKVSQGDHLTVLTTSDVALNGNTSGQVAQLLPGVSPYGSGLLYLNPKAFAKPTTGTYGNTSFGEFVGPSWWQWDASIYRDFRIRESYRIEARAEAFNVTNSFRAADPVTSLNSGQFGLVTSQVSNVVKPGDLGPRIMQFALKFFY